MHHADKMEVTSILKALSSCDIHRDISTIRCRLFDLLMLSRNGVNIQPALPTVAKLLALSDAFVKRTAGEIMVIHCSENQDVALLAINTLVQDCEDLNPVIRGLSFKIVGNLSINVISDVFNSSVSKGLSDQNVYVRRAAARSSIGLNRVSSSTVLESDIWDLLYCRLRDEDSMTVASCLCALEEVCASEKGVVVSNKMGQYLIKNMASYTPSVQRLVLQFLTKFSPKSKSLVFDCLNELDDHLSKSKSIVNTLCTLNLFCHLTADLPHVKPKVYKVAWATMNRILSGERSEEFLAACIHFMNATDFPVEDFCKDVTKFLCQEGDSPYLINQKIKFLSRVINNSNMDKIFGDFLSCIRTLGKESLKNLVESIANIANHKKELRKACAHFLKQLMDTKKSEIVDEVLQILPSISMNDDVDTWVDVISTVEANQSLVTSIHGQMALLQVIQSYPSGFPEAAEIFEHFIIKVVEGNQDPDRIMELQAKQEQRTHKENQTNDWFKITLLSAVIQAFLCSPAKIHPFLVRIMELCIQDSSRSVREKGLFYYSFLLGRVQQLVESN